MLELKKELLNYMLTRTYNVDMFEDLENILDEYEDGDCEQWIKEKIDNTIYLFEKIYGKYDDPECDLAYELGMLRGYEIAMNEFNSINKNKDE